MSMYCTSNNQLQRVRKACEICFVACYLGISTDIDSSAPNFRYPPPVGISYLDTQKAFQALLETEAVASAASRTDYTVMAQG